MIAAKPPLPSMSPMAVGEPHDGFHGSIKPVGTLWQPGVGILARDTITHAQYAPTLMTFAEAAQTAEHLAHTQAAIRFADACIGDSH